jgi:hypothetical protein
VFPGLRQVHWNLVIVAEAHRMSASDPEHKTQRYRPRRDASDHILLLRATAHRGDHDNVSFFSCSIPMVDLEGKGTVVVEKHNVLMVAAHDYRNAAQGRPLQVTGGSRPNRWLAIKKVVLIEDPARRRPCRVQEGQPVTR